MDSVERSSIASNTRQGIDSNSSRVRAEENHSVLDLNCRLAPAQEYDLRKDRTDLALAFSPVAGERLRSVRRREFIRRASRVFFVACLVSAAFAKAVAMLDGNRSLRVA